MGDLKKFYKTCKKLGDMTKEDRTQELARFFGEKRKAKLLTTIHADR